MEGNIRNEKGASASIEVGTKVWLKKNDHNTVIKLLVIPHDKIAQQNICWICFHKCLSL